MGVLKSFLVPARLGSKAACLEIWGPGDLASFFKHDISCCRILERVVSRVSISTVVSSSTGVCTGLRRLCSKDNSPPECSQVLHSPGHGRVALSLGNWLYPMIHPEFLSP